MKEARIPAVNLKLQHEALRSEIEDAIGRVFARQSFILGTEVQELEQELARRHGAAHAIGVASGSDALLLSLMAIGVGPGDAVLVPAFTFFSTAGSVARLGARPFFVDIDPRTFNISPTAVEEVLQRQASSSGIQGVRAKALIPVHLYGQCADMKRLAVLTAQHRLAVVEDAAQAVLARYAGRAAGSMGVTGCFSFYPTKNLAGAGDGGMITTSDTPLAERLRLLRNHGSAERKLFPLVGINSRLDTLQAAILLVKLRRLEDWTRLRRNRAQFYRLAFAERQLASAAQRYPSADTPIVLPFEDPEAEHVWHQFTVRAHRRDELAAYLESNGIETAVYYPVPLPRQPAFAPGAGEFACPEADRAAREVLSLPMYPELTPAQQTRVVNQIQQFYRR